VSAGARSRTARAGRPLILFQIGVYVALPRFPQSERDCDREWLTLRLRLPGKADTWPTMRGITALL
jgi:hypothetical protein